MVLNRIDLIRLSVKLEVETTSVRKGFLADDSASGWCSSRIRLHVCITLLMLEDSCIFIHWSSSQLAERETIVRSKPTFKLATEWEKKAYLNTLCYTMHPHHSYGIVASS